MNRKTNNQIRKFLYGIMLVGLFLSLGFGKSGTPTALAQGAVTDTYQIYLPLVFMDYTSPSYPNQTLTVNKSGTGSGTVTSPGGINCGSTCSYDFAYNTVVTLTATPTPPSTFGGWSGAGCSGTGTCIVTMSTAQSVTATFNLSANGIINGDFESGTTGWTEFSSNGWPVIYSCADPSQCNDITPHSGIYLAWLGGDFDETSYIQQQVTIPSSAPYLVYWQWIGSDDYCGSYNDYANVLINSNLEDKYDLCAGTSTIDWVPHSINLSAYAGQSVTLKIGVVMDSSYLSNLYVDDVSFQASALTLESFHDVAPDTKASTSTGKPGIVVQGKKP